MKEKTVQKMTQCLLLTQTFQNFTNFTPNINNLAKNERQMTTTLLTFGSEQEQITLTKDNLGFEE